MKRTLGWSSLFLALASGCGDDTASGEESTGTPGTTTGVGTSGADTDPTTTGETTGVDPDTGTTGGPVDTGSETTGSTGVGTSDGTTGGLAPMGVQDHIGGGRPGATVIAGSHAYIATGPRITVWDISDTESPTQVGTTDALSGLVTGIVVRGDYMYVSMRLDLEGSVAVFDVSDPATPLYVGPVDYTNNQYRVPTDVAVDGATLFISDNEVGIVSLDISGDPEQPTVVETLQVFGVEDIWVSSGRMRYRTGAFVGGADIGTVVHIDGDMTEIGSASMPDQGMDAAFEGDTVYNAGQFGFFGYDYADADAPATVFSEGNVTGYSVQAASNVAYNFGNRLTVFDFTTVPPSQGVTVPAPTARTTASTIGGRLLLGATELGRGLLFDISSALAPSVSSIFDLPVGASPSAIGFGSSGMIVSNFYTGLRVVNPVDSSTMGRFDLFSVQPAVEDVVVEGNRAYLADWSYGLHIVDVADGERPGLMGEVETPGFPSAVAVAGDYAYIGEGSGGGAVQVIDVSDPSSPTIVGSIATTKVRDLVYAEGYVYAADEQVLGVGGMRIIDVSNPAAPVQTAHYTGCQSALGVAVQGTRAYLACADDESLHIVDVSNPAAPVMEHSVGVGGTGVTSVAVADGRAWVGWGLGITEVDIEDPGDPEVLYHYDTVMRVDHIHIRSDTVFAVTGMGGIYRISFQG